MKRKYIKPTTSVVRVETQNNYCTVASWSARDASGHVQYDYDMGRVITDKDDAVHEYDPWNPEKW